MEMGKIKKKKNQSFLCDARKMPIEKIYCTHIQTQKLLSENIYIRSHTTTYIHYQQRIKSNQRVYTTYKKGGDIL